MKVGFDIDGTITEAKELFIILSNALYCSGHEIHIITFRDDKEQTIAELNTIGIKYHYLHLPEDGDEHHTWKGILAESIGLDVMFDDSPEVLMNMPKRVRRFWFCDPEIFDLKAAIMGMRADARTNVIG